MLLQMYTKQPYLTALCSGYVRRIMQILSMYHYLTLPLKLGFKVSSFHPHLPENESRAGASLILKTCLVIRYLFHADSCKL